VVSLALALALALPRADVPAAARAALLRALALPGARLEVTGWSSALPPGCEPSEADVPRPVAASGRAPLRLRGAARGVPCEGWAWAQVRVFAPSLRAWRAIPEGEPVEPAAALAEQEVLPGRAPMGALPPGALAARAIAAGASIDPGAVRLGPRPGEAVTVILRRGPLTVEQAGRALPCARGRACALLPSGRRVEGRPDAGRIAVEMP
jgi:hypothetical protein